MKVALGTYDVTDEERKAIKKALGFRGGKASREEARDFILDAAGKALRAAGFGDPEEAIAADDAAAEGLENESEDQP